LPQLHIRPGQQSLLLVQFPKSGTQPPEAIEMNKKKIGQVNKDLAKVSKDEEKRLEKEREDKEREETERRAQEGMVMQEQELS